MIRLLALLALLVPSIALAQFGFGPGAATNIVGAALTSCTASQNANYIIVDPVDPATCDEIGRASCRERV